jgi:hypothetical protein
MDIYSDVYKKCDPLKICKNCRSSLENKNRALYEYYVEICVGAIVGYPIVEKTNMHGNTTEFTSQLEKHGYITSIELNKDMVVLKPNGYSFENGMHKFCKGC